MVFGCAAVALTNLFEDLDKYVTRTGTAQERLAPIAARGDEMQIPAAVNAYQAPGHGPALYKSNFNPEKLLTPLPPTLRKSRRMGHPHYGSSKEKQDQGTRRPL
jgi:hypothetical protein